MNKEKFTSILKEFNYSEQQIDEIWNSRGNRVLEEEALRRTCILMQAAQELNSKTKD